MSLRRKIQDRDAPFACAANRRREQRVLLRGSVVSGVVDVWIHRRIMYVRHWVGTVPHHQANFERPPPITTRTGPRIRATWLEVPRLTQ